MEYKLMGMYLWESSLETFPDAIDHKIKFGVEIVSLKEVLSNDIQQDDMYFRKLNVNNREKILHRKSYKKFTKLSKINLMISCQKIG